MERERCMDLLGLVVDMNGFIRFGGGDKIYCVVIIEDNCLHFFLGVIVAWQKFYIKEIKKADKEWVALVPQLLASYGLLDLYKCI